MKQKSHNINDISSYPIEKPLLFMTIKQGKHIKTDNNTKPTN